MNFFKIFYTIYKVQSININLKNSDVLFRMNRKNNVKILKSYVFYIFLRNRSKRVERRNSLVSSHSPAGNPMSDRQYCLRIIHKARARCIHIDNCSVNACCNNVDATICKRWVLTRISAREIKCVLSICEETWIREKWFSFLTRVWIIFKRNLWYNNSSMRMKYKKVFVWISGNIEVIIKEIYIFTPNILTKYIFHTLLKYYNSLTRSKK